MNSANRNPAQQDAGSGATSGDVIHTQGSFFGRRKGHKLRLHQADLIEHLLPRLALDINGPSPSDLAELFDRPLDGARLETRLEIGFGGGEHLVAEALAFPNLGFIGCEPYVNGMAKILAQIEAHNIGNIRLFAGDAAELLAWAPPCSLTRIDLIQYWRSARNGQAAFFLDEDGNPTTPLQNGTTYAIGVTTSDLVFNESKLSGLRCGTPREVTTFFEGYKDAGGVGGGGFCSYAPSRSQAGWVVALGLGAAWFARRSARAWGRSASAYLSERMSMRPAVAMRLMPRAAVPAAPPAASARRRP